MKKKQKVIAVLNRFFSFILIAVLLFAGYVFLTVMRTPKNQVPAVFGFSFLRVATGSMEPTIPTGAIIIVRQTDPEEVKVGDVITFYSPDPLLENMPNTHRVTAILQENGTTSFITKGDAGVDDDPYPVEAERLVGVYKLHFTLGKLPEIVHSKVFFFLAMLVPLCAVISVEFLRVKKMSEAKEARRLAAEQQKAEKKEAEKEESNEQDP
jgi:signal peptidase